MASRRKYRCKKQVPYLKTTSSLEEEDGSASTSQTIHEATGMPQQQCNEKTTAELALQMAMTEWQQRTRTVRDRDLYLLQNQLWTDCTFAVGPKKKRFQCHRLIMAKTSPVFAAMLYGAMYKHGKVIDLPDDTPEVFTALLQYIYEGTVKFDKYSDACNLLAVAKKYIMPDLLIDNIRSYLWMKMYPSNVWTALQYALQDEEQELMDTSLQIILRETEECIILPDFCLVCEDVLVSLLTKDDLTCSELDLFNACKNWAIAEATRRHLSPNSESLRETFLPLLPHIRFLSMTHKELTNGPAKSKVFTEQEMVSIFANVSISGSKPLPDIICKNTELRKPARNETFFVYRQPYDIVTDFHNNTCVFFTHIRACLRENQRVFEVNIPTQKKEILHHPESYEEEVTVYVKEEDSGKILGHLRAGKTVQYNSVLNVPYTLRESILEDTYVVIHVVFHKTGIYPEQCYVHRFRGNMHVI